MGFTIRQSTTTEFEDNLEIKQFIEGLYKSPRNSPAPEYCDGVQFEYDDFNPSELDDLLGEVAKSNSPVGIFLDVDPVKMGDYFIYSITRLASSFPPNTAKGKRRTPKDKLLSTISKFASKPLGDYPVVIIWW